MKIRKRLPVLVVVAALLAGVSVPTWAQPQNGDAAITIGEKDIGGLVSGLQGREAGVWVIAETTELPTRFSRIVVTDDQGRYVLPELPKANYDVWVRGYGLVDSPKIKSAPGRIVNLTATVAPSEAAAAEYYPAQYWYAMLEIPERSMFPGTGPNGNGMPERIRSQGQWIATLKTHGCNSCHQVGNKPTRTISKAASPTRCASGPAAVDPARKRPSPCRSRSGRSRGRRR